MTFSERIKMNFLADKRKRKIFIITMSIILTLAVIAGACTIYLGDYYRADNVQEYLESSSNVKVTKIKNGWSGCVFWEY